MMIFIIKLEQYKDGEGYEGYFLVIDNNFNDAVEQIKKTNEYKDVEKYGGSILFKQTTLHEIRNWDFQSVHMLCSDNYN